MFCSNESSISGREKPSRNAFTCHVLKEAPRLTVNRFGLLSLKTNIDEILTLDANFLLTVTILFSLPILTFVQ